MHFKEYGKFALSIVGILIVPVLVIVLAARFDLVQEYIYPMILLWAIALIVIGLPLAVFRATRAFAGAMMVWWSVVFGGYIWLLCLTIVIASWGVFPALIGVFIVGIGNIPFAIICSAIGRHWHVLWVIVVDILLAFGVRFFGLWLGGGFQTDSE